MLIPKIALATQIIIALILGVLLGLAANQFQFQTFVNQWIAPFGTLFIKALKFIAIPLIVISLLHGFAALTDLSRLGKLAAQTVVGYLLTTIGAVIFGLLLGNFIQPGTWIGEETRTELIAEQETVNNTQTIEPMPLQPLVDLVPDLGKVNMISLIVLTLIFAITVTRLPDSSRTQLSSLFAALNDWVIQIINYLMKYLAPIGVFALMAKVAAQTMSGDLFYALAVYGLTVVFGLLFLAFIVYPLLVYFLTGMPIRVFRKGIIPAQLLAFSTSSSAATLAMTMKCVEEDLGVRKDVTGFVLPLGATLNMDGTSLYQGVICLFIAQAFGIDLSIGTQLLIVATVTISSIGSAAVPSGGIVMLAIVLEQVGLPVTGLALILALDRPLDMLRTVVNITGDAAIAVSVDKYSR